MSNFNLKQSAIYQALKWKWLFRWARPLTLIFFLLSIILAIPFFLGLISHNKPLMLGGFCFINYAGFALIFFALFLFFWNADLFFNLKLKHPRITQSNNLADFLSFESADVINSAGKLAKKHNISPISSTLLLYTLLKYRKKGVNLVFIRLLLNPKKLLPILWEQAKIKEKLTSEIFSESFKKTIEASWQRAKSKNRQEIKNLDLLAALAENEPIFKKLLIEINLKPADVKSLILWEEEQQKRWQEKKQFWRYKNLIRYGSIAKDWASGYTIFLDKFSIDWTRILKAKSFPEIIGYQDEIKQVETILASPEINNVLLIGEPGVGMKNIIYAFAIKSALGQTIAEINYERVVELKMPSLLSSLKNLDEVEEVLNRIFKEVVNAGNIVLVIDDFYNYVGAQQTRLGTIDITSIISSYLHLPQFRLIALTSYAGLHRNIAQRPSILNLFEKVEVKEPTKEETIDILERQVPVLERRYKRYFSYQALKEVVDLSARYFPAIPFPKKAEDLLEEVVVEVANTKNVWILPKDVDKLVSQKTEIPVGKIGKKEKEILLNLEEEIHKRIINQNEAVNDISAALRRARAQIEIRKAPMGSFLFLGPTGVGKTETSKALAQIYFGSEEKMIRLDMSEFQAIKNIPRLIGSPGEEGLLTTPVRENPFSLVLFDELEKAHPNILNLFLQVLDEGYLTDGLGRKVDFKNTIIIATSNAGYKLILKSLEEKTDLSSIKEKLLNYLFQNGIFRPEFINRFDAVVIFKPLTKQNLLDIAQLMLEKLKKNLSQKNIEFVITEPLKEKIVELGYDIKFGARNMQRVIQDKVENPLAEALLRGDIKRGDKITVTSEFEVKKI